MFHEGSCLIFGLAVVFREHRTRQFALPSVGFEPWYQDLRNHHTPKLVEDASSFRTPSALDRPGSHSLQGDQPGMGTTDLACREIRHKVQSGGFRFGAYGASLTSSIAFVA